MNKNWNDRTDKKQTTDRMRHKNKNEKMEREREKKKKRHEQEQESEQDQAQGQEQRTQSIINQVGSTSSLNDKHSYYKKKSKTSQINKGDDED